MIANNDFGPDGMTNGFQRDAYGRVVRTANASAEGDPCGFAQPDGKIVAAGQRNNTYMPDDAIALVRYHDAVRLYVQQDANFNVTAVTDSAGVVLERYVYEPYGSFTVLNADWSADEDDQSDNGQLHLHQGGRYDAVSGLYHFRHRDYSPSLGRWVQQDPMGYVDGMSLYEYVRSGPVAATDPSGLVRVDTANRDIRDAYDEARFSAVGSRIFREIEELEGCIRAEVVVNITPSASRGSNAGSGPVKMYWRMENGKPQQMSVKKKTWVLSINPLDKLLSENFTIGYQNNGVDELRVGAPLAQIIIHEAAHILQMMRADNKRTPFSHQLSGSTYTGQYPNDNEEDAVAWENDYLSSIQAGISRTGHGLTQGQKALLAAVAPAGEELYRMGAGGDLRDWPIFPEDEFRFELYAGRGQLTELFVTTNFKWLRYFEGGPDRFRARLAEVNAYL